MAWPMGHRGPAVNRLYGIRCEGGLWPAFGFYPVVRWAGVCFGTGSPKDSGGGSPRTGGWGLREDGRV